MSKAMEATGLVEMLIRAPEKYGVSIWTIISDDDSKVKGMIILK
jgi:hypothetical protein